MLAGKTKNDRKRKGRKNILDLPGIGKSNKGKHLQQKLTSATAEDTESSLSSNIQRANNTSTKHDVSTTLCPLRTYVDNLYFLRPRRLAVGSNWSVQPKKYTLSSLHEHVADITIAPLN